jgi:hypothetical protein
MRNHPPDRKRQQNQSNKYRPDQSWQNKAPDRKQPRENPSDLYLTPMTSLMTYRPAHQAAKGWKPDPGELPELLC